MIKQKIPFPLKLDFTQKRQGFSLLLMGMVVALGLSVLAYLYAWGASWLWWILALGTVVGILNIFHDEGA